MQERLQKRKPGAGDLNLICFRLVAAVSGDCDKPMSLTSKAGPSKCPKFYTSRILAEQNLRQKEQKI